ncbi:MAG: DUF2891 domain-containing protein [Deltaproteobacteria bacterium]|nr:DUF2891 domain-containing protein [Deltaproteobacteria bacterium]
MKDSSPLRSNIRRDIILLGLSVVFLVIGLYLLKMRQMSDNGSSNASVREKERFYDGSSYEKRCPKFNVEKALKLVQLSLNCISKEYPNKPNYVFESDADLLPPRINTPAFFGCFDWHSAVHGHWAMVRILNEFPDIEGRAVIKENLKLHLSEDRIASEIRFFKEKRNQLFERPYGWGWLLRLASELRKSNDPEIRVLFKNIKPFADYLSFNFVAYLNQLSRPIREGTHQNTAFSMIHLYDYLKSVNEMDLLNTVVSRATVFYYNDRNCPIDYEPSGEDFISPCLTEADLMRRILLDGQFEEWFDRFLPDEKLRSSLKPVEIINPEDPRIGHLIGLFYQRASAIKGIIASLSSDDYRRKFFEDVMDMNCAAAEEYIGRSGYGGEHWLASFAIFFYTNATIR